MSSSPSYLLERSNDYVTVRNYASCHFANRTILWLTKIVCHLSGGCVEGGSDFPFLCFHITLSLMPGHIYPVESFCELLLQCHRNIVAGKLSFYFTVANQEYVDLKHPEFRVKLIKVGFKNIAVIYHICGLHLKCFPSVCVWTVVARWWCCLGMLWKVIRCHLTMDMVWISPFILPRSELQNKQQSSN